MSEKNDRNTLPKWCHTVLPQEGSLVIITYGESGYKISPLDTCNREENRRIADRKNEKLIGRLIRSETDKGIVSIIDSRVGDKSNAPYKDIIWKSLPIKNRTNDISDIEVFYKTVVDDE